jgi:hypothetical protein
MPPSISAISANCISVEWLATWRMKRFSPKRGSIVE